MRVFVDEGFLYNFYFSNSFLILEGKATVMKFFTIFFQGKGIKWFKERKEVLHILLASININSHVNLELYHPYSAGKRESQPGVFARRASGAN